MKTNRVMVLVVGSVMQLLLGIIYVWSMFVAPVTEFFGMTVESAKLTATYMLACFVLGILLGGRLLNKISSQKITLIGGLLLSVGMALTALLPANMGVLIYFTYGGIGGIGVGMGYNSILTASQKHFPDKRGLATGISVCTFGFSTVIFAPLIPVLTGSIGLQNTLFLLAGIGLVVTLACFSFISMPEAGAANASFTGKQFETKEMLKTKEFYFIAVSMMFGISLYFILNPSFNTLAQERGLTAELATVMVMLTGIANALGRLFFPLLSDKAGIKIAASSLGFLTAISGFALIFISGIPLMIAVILTAFCYGGFSGTYPILTGKTFGLKNIGSNYGMVMVGFALSALVFPTVLSFVPDMTMKFVILSILALVSAGLILPLKKS